MDRWFWFTFAGICMCVSACVCLCVCLSCLNLDWLFGGKWGNFVLYSSRIISILKFQLIFRFVEAKLSVFFLVSAVSLSLRMTSLARNIETRFCNQDVQFDVNHSCGYSLYCRGHPAIGIWRVLCISNYKLLITSRRPWWRPWTYLGGGPCMAPPTPRVW